jgi:hypothetical protein
LGGGDRAPARDPRFGLIMLPGRKIGKGEGEMKLGGNGSEVHDLEGAFGARRKSGSGIPTGTFASQNLQIFFETLRVGWPLPDLRLHRTRLDYSNIL